MHFYSLNLICKKSFEKTIFKVEIKTTILYTTLHVYEYKIFEANLAGLNFSSTNKFRFGARFFRFDDNHIRFFWARERNTFTHNKRQSLFEASRLRCVAYYIYKITVHVT